MPTTHIADTILNWHQGIERSMPWLFTDDPYQIWISEIILQQTQVSQGTAYFHKFIKLYPTVHDLAASSLDNLLKAWEGLGYNSRARNLHKASKIIVEQFNGKFPTTFEDIQSLPGIGDYTASAISAFAYNQPYVAVDTNVERWVSRYLGINGYKSSPQLRKEVKSYLLPFVESHESARNCNQAFIDFGALVCKSRQPQCTDCPLSDTCYGHSKNQETQFPLPKPKKKRRHRYFQHYVCIAKDKVLIDYREAQDIWKGMYEFPQIEPIDPANSSELQIDFIDHLMPDELASVQQFSQTLTHQVIHATFHTYVIESVFESTSQWITLEELVNLPVSGVVRLYLAKNNHIFKY